MSSALAAGQALPPRRRGFSVEDPKDIKGALDEAMNFRCLALVNVLISQGSARKAGTIPLGLSFWSAGAAKAHPRLEPRSHQGPLCKERPFFFRAPRVLKSVHQRPRDSGDFALLRT